MDLWRTLSRLYKDEYEILGTNMEDRYEIVIMPRKHDYIPNAVLEEFSAVLGKYANYGFSIYLIDVKPFLIDTAYGYMVTSYTPRILIKIYERQLEEIQK